VCRTQGPQFLLTAESPFSFLIVPLHAKTVLGFSGRHTRFQLGIFAEDALQPGPPLPSGLYGRRVNAVGPVSQFPFLFWYCENLPDRKVSLFEEDPAGPPRAARQQVYFVNSPPPHPSVQCPPPSPSCFCLEPLFFGNSFRADFCGGLPLHNWAPTAPPLPSRFFPGSTEVSGIAFPLGGRLNGALNTRSCPIDYFFGRVGWHGPPPF